MDKINNKDIEILLENLNNVFDPITNEINNNLSFLYKCVGEKPHTDFNRITMKDIEK